ncbi:ABC transporter ATP-binding protein [Brevibacillus composti]|uniref:ABC transporter ATP-binding protein n=1 Tax=Brevibacillus composti TaxID=2796470 RepID=A0A7T5JQ38_9BACL|nr:ABC transporter ATP-binding protein [Brevibacillus composti]QUO42838.1 ABC transporter ATP-binding protein [Brevibacillus composti]
MINDPILTVENLHVSFHSQNRVVNAVRGVSFQLEKGETLAIVGESGSGKSVTAKSVLRLLPSQTAKITDGAIRYGKENVLSYSPRQLQRLRGKEISMVFQDPMTSLNPTMKIGRQIMEGLARHEKLTRAEAKQKAVQMLEMVGIPQAAERIDAYPHQFSGGMRQRVVIALALACRPKVLIADEPTTALDVTIQAQILDLMRDLQQKTGTAIILITHDLGVVAHMAQRVAVMYTGEIVEIGPVREIFANPQHPYTKGLLASMPRLDADRSEPLVPIPGSPPDATRLAGGCSFAPRCPYVMKVCHHFSPEVTSLAPDHQVSCWLQDKRAENVRSALRF